MAKRDKAVVLACERLAVGLRLGEKSYEQIADLVVIPGSQTQENPEGKRAYSNAGAAQKAVMRALKRDLKPDAEELTLKMQGQLAEAMGAIFPDVLRGKLGAIDRMISLQRQWGTLVPDVVQPERQTHEITGPGGVAAPFVVELALPRKGGDEEYPFEPKSPGA